MRIKQLKLRIKRPKVILALFFILYSLFFISPVFAQGNVGSSRLSPDNPLYFLKAVRESLEIKFAGTERVRILKRLEFAQRRLREVNGLIKADRQDLVPSNMEKFLLEVNLVRPVQEESSNPLISRSLGSYMEALIALYANLTDRKAKQAVRSIIFRIMDFNFTYYTNMDPGLAKQIFPSQEPKFGQGCRFLTEEASSSASNESEKQVLISRGERCLNLLTRISDEIN